MSSIKVTYNSNVGLVQKKGTPGVYLGSVPITYSHSVESVNNVSGDHTVAGESFIIVDAANTDVTITLPELQNGRHLTIKKIDETSNTVTIVPNGSETIDGGANVIITTQWTSVTLQAIEENWYIR